jgi:hypothetical protein
LRVRSIPKAAQLCGRVRNRFPLPLPTKAVRLCERFLEAIMDDKDKNVIEQIVDKINDAVETVATVAADALSQAMEPDPVKEDHQPISEPPMPFTVMPVHAPTKKPRAKKAVAAKSTINVSGRITPTYEFPAPDSVTMPVSIPTKKTKKDAAKKKSQKTVKKPVKKSAKKVAMKSVARKSTKAAKNATKKNTKMVAKKRRANKVKR